MPTYLDNASSLLIQGKSLRYDFGFEAKGWISLASNLIQGQATGQVVTFSVYSKKTGVQTISLAYGTTMKVEFRGYTILTSTAGSPNASIRVVIADVPQDLTVQTVAATITGTASVSIDGQTVGVAPSTALAGAAVDPRDIRNLGSSDQPDITANQSAALGSSGNPVYTRPLGASDQPDTSVNQAQDTKVDIKKPLTTPGGYVETYNEATP